MSEQRIGCEQNYFYAGEKNHNENKMPYLLFILISLLTSLTIKQIQTEKKKREKADTK